MKFTIAVIVFLFLLAPAVHAEGLKITEIDARVDYDEAYTYRLENKHRLDFASVNLANNSKIDIDILPGSNVTLTIRVENTFKGEDPEIKGIVVRGTLKEIDDGADLEEESLDFDLKPGDDNRIDIKFAIPLEVDASTYTTVLEAEGEDRNGTSYIDELRLKLEVKKQGHDIRVIRASLSPVTVECDRKIKLSADIMNVGSNTENQLVLEFKSDSLGLNSKDSSIFLDSSNEASEEDKIYSKALNFIVPDSVREGTYKILFNLYWKNIVLFDQKTENIIVKNCGQEALNDNESSKLKDETKEPEESKPSKEQEGNNIFNIPITKNLRSLKTPAFSLIVFGGFLIVIIAVVISFGYLRKKNR